MGARELVHGILCLAHDKHYCAWSRVAGDAVDLAGLAALYRDDNPKRGVGGVAIAAIVGCTMVDFSAAKSLSDLHGRKGPVRDYRDRSGFPKGLDYSRGQGVGTGSAGLPGDSSRRGGLTGNRRELARLSPP